MLHENYRNIARFLHSRYLPHDQRGVLPSVPPIPDTDWNLHYL